MLSCGLTIPQKRQQQLIKDQRNSLRYSVANQGKQQEKPTKQERRYKKHGKTTQAERSRKSKEAVRSKEKQHKHRKAGKAKKQREGRTSKTKIPLRLVVGFFPVLHSPAHSHRMLSKSMTALRLPTSCVMVCNLKMPRAFTRQTVA